MKLLIGVFTVFVLFCGSEGALQLVWSDEFNGTSVSAAEWDFVNKGDGFGNGEEEFYTPRNVNVRAEGGHAIIDVKVEDHEGKHYTSAKFTSKKAWTYGKFEAKIKLPKGQSLWPAFWMMPKDSKYGGWAASGEIDIMEYRGEQNSIIMGTIHYGGSWPNNMYTGSGEKNMGKDLSADFHTYAVEWDKTSIKWLFDGTVYHTENIDRNMWSHRGTNPYNHNGAPFDQSFYIIFNVAVGGNFFGNLPRVTPAGAKNWPKHTMEIDYVRVYQ